MRKDSPIRIKETLKPAKTLQREMAFFLLGIIIGIVTNYLADFIPDDWRNLGKLSGLFGFLISVFILVCAGFYILALFERIHPRNEFRFNISRRLWKNVEELQLGEFHKKIEKAKKSPSTFYYEYCLTIQILECIKVAVLNKKRFGPSYEKFLFKNIADLEPKVSRNLFIGRKMKLPQIEMIITVFPKYATVEYEAHPSYFSILEPKWDEKILNLISFCEKLVNNACRNACKLEDLKIGLNWLETLGGGIEYTKPRSKGKQIVLRDGRVVTIEEVEVLSDKQFLSTAFSEALDAILERFERGFLGRLVETIRHIARRIIKR